MTATTIPTGTTVPTSTDAPARHSTRPIWKTGVSAGLGAAVVNVVITSAARVADIPLTINGEAVPVIGFAQVTIFATLIGVVLAAQLARRARRPQHTFVVVTVALSALSLVTPFTGDAGVATRVVFELTHLAAAAIVIPAIAGTLRRGSVR
jgi:hypothetical protein